MNTITIFHATREINVQSILQSGLKLGTSWMDRAPSVYFTQTIEDALQTIRRFIYSDRRALITLEVPASWAASFIEDEYHNEDFDTASAARIECEIPANYIRSVATYRCNGYDRDAQLTLVGEMIINEAEEVEEALCCAPCKACENEPRMLLTKRATGETYFWTYCEDCERARKS